MKWLVKVAYILVIIGGLNWGLVGFFDFNLVESIFGTMASIARAVYVLVGLSSLMLIFMHKNECDCFKKNACDCDCGCVSCGDTSEKASGDTTNE